MFSHHPCFMTKPFPSDLVSQHCKVSPKTLSFREGFTYEISIRQISSNNHKKKKCRFYGFFKFEIDAWSEFLWTDYSYNSSSDDFQVSILIIWHNNDGINDGICALNWMSYIKWNYSPSWQLYPPLEICIFLYKTSLQYERFYINKIKKNTQNNLVPRESINPKWRRRTCYFEIWWLNDWFLVSILCLRRWRWLSAALCHNHKHTSLRRSGVKNDHSLRNMF